MTATVCLIEICHRPTEIKGNNNFCARHEMAFGKIQNSFLEWKIAYGEKYRINKYYQNLLTNVDVLSGKWVKEVVKHLFEAEPKQ